MFRLHEVKKVMNSDLILKSTSADFFNKGVCDFKGVGIDSRVKQNGKLFIAIKGEKFDGHDFLEEAVQNGAGGLMVRTAHELPSSLNTLIKKQNVSVFKVKNTRKALQSLAVAWRKTLKLKVIGITGSCGKTTTRQFVSSLLSCESSKQSYNNQWGVPLSLLSAQKRGGFFAQEIGVSRKGEMAPLVRLCEPEIVAVTMVGSAHLGGFQSFSDLIGEKASIYKESADAVWVFNISNAHTKKMYDEFGFLSNSSFTFSMDDSDASDVSFRILSEKKDSMKISGRIQYIKGEAELPFSGEGNLENLMCAVALALAAGLSPEEIWKQIPNCETPKGRGDWLQTQKGCHIYFDAYNANPESMKLFLKKMSGISERAFLILGDMNELGEASVSCHQALSHSMEHIEGIWFVGRYGLELEKALKARGWRGFFKIFPEVTEDLITSVSSFLKPGDCVGVKGSRKFQLEKCVEKLTGQKWTWQ